MGTILRNIVLFVVATIGIMWVSRASLRDVQHHGFYRFFAWETILIMFLLNVDEWFVDPFSPVQIVSWLFLTVSLALILLGLLMFLRHGDIDYERVDPTLAGVEKTTKLVSTGIYRYIRHPFYSSLLFLGWGIFLKNVNWIGALLAMINTVLLTVTAKIEESENIQYFGNRYREYMKQTKMFIPYIF